MALVLAISAVAAGSLTFTNDPDAGGHGPQAALSAEGAPVGHPHFGRTAQILDHVAGAEKACLPAGASDQASPQKAQLSRLFRVLEKSPLGRDLLAQAAMRDVYICLDDDTELLAYYFSGLRLIGVQSSLDEGERIGFLAHELAHVPQHPIYSDNRYFPATDLMLLRRVREAAAEAIATCIAWQLQEAGYPEAWRAKRDGAYSDLAASFESVMEDNGSASGAAGGEPAATRAAFDSWFSARWRLNVYDRMTVDHLARIADDEMGLVAPRLQLSHRFLLGIGRYGRGNFLARTSGRPLTDDYYRGAVSRDTIRDLEAIARPSRATGDPDGPWSFALGS